MKHIENIKTNGYTLNPRTTEFIGLFMDYCDHNLPVKSYDVFYWSERMVFVTVNFAGGYGHFHISDKSIRFNGHTASNENYLILCGATKNDELYKSRLPDLD